LLDQGGIDRWREKTIERKTQQRRREKREKKVWGRRKGNEKFYAK